MNKKLALKKSLLNYFKNKEVNTGDLRKHLIHFFNQKADDVVIKKNTESKFVDFDSDHRFKKNLIKSHEVPVGTVKAWSDGKKYQKQADGSWRELPPKAKNKSK